MQRHAQRSYNKSKLTDLRQTETALHGRLQRLPRQQHPQRPEEGLSENDRQSNHDNRSRILHNHSRVYHHADRYEKDGAKQVLDRLHQALYALRLYRFGKNGAHDKCTESSRKSRMRSHHHHTETESKRDYQQSFLAHQPPAPLQQSGDEVNTHHEPKYQEEQQFGNTLQHLRTLKVMADCHRGEHHHQYDGKNILQNKHTEHQTRELLLAHPQIIKRLIDNGGGRHGNHTAQKYAVHPFPAETGTYRHTQQYHTKDDGTRSNNRCPSHLHNLLEAEFQSQCKQQEDNTYICPGLYISRIHHRRCIGHVRAGKESCNYIS